MHPSGKSNVAGRVFPSKTSYPGYGIRFYEIMGALIRSEMNVKRRKDVSGLITKMPVCRRAQPHVAVQQGRHALVDHHTPYRPAKRKLMMIPYDDF